MTGTVHTITIDKCAGTQLILNKESLGVEVVTAKSDSFNIIVPGENEGDEFKEHPIPEQFISKYDGKKWTTECLAHTG